MPIIRSPGTAQEFDGARTGVTHTQRRASAWRDARVWHRTLMLGLPIGLLQAALNQGDHWWRHDVNALVLTKTILSPLLSCSIAFASAVAARATRTSKSISK